MTERTPDAEATRSAPLMKQNDHTMDDALDGIAVQTRADLTRSPGVQVRELLHQRLQDAGITIDDEAFEDLVRRVASSTETLDLQPGVTD